MKIFVTVVMAKVYQVSSIKYQDTRLKDSRHQTKLCKKFTIEF